MPSEPLVQRDFSGGEIAKHYWGRAESRAYQTGLRLAKNFIPTLDGPLLNRSGTRFVVEVQDSTYAPRLFTFSFTDGQTFVLEIGDHYLRVIQNGALVGGLVVTGAVPWAIADVMRLVAAQNGDVITFTCVNGSTEYAPYTITRVDNTHWTVAQGSTAGTAFTGKPRVANAQTPGTGNGGGGMAAVSNLNAAWSSGATYSKGDFVLYTIANTGAWAGGLTYTIGQCVSYGGTNYRSLVNGNIGNQPDTHPVQWALDAAADGLPHLYQSTADNNLNSSPDGLVNANWFDWTFNTFAPASYAQNNYAWSSTKKKLFVSVSDLNTSNPDGDDGSHWQLAIGVDRPVKLWQVVATKLVRDALGRVTETLGSTPTPSNLSFARYTDRPAIWVLDTEVPAAGTQILSYNFYAGRNGIFGLLGAVPYAATQVLFKDDGIDPDYGQQPPRGTDPFLLGTGGDSYPAVVTYHEQRALYARSNKKPQTFWGSKIGDYQNFDVNTPVEDSDSFEFKPASERLEDIRGLLSLRHLLLFTGGGVFNGYGPSGAITPSTGIILRRASRDGSSFLRPLAVGLSGLFYTARGRVRDLNWDWRSDNYAGRDVSAIARHLLESRTFVDWAYAEYPFSLIYAVRDDGVLLTLTYAAGGIEAWAQHATAGVFERVVSVVETDPVTGAFEDAVYVVVKRIINGATKRYIERFSSRILPQSQILAADGTSTFTKDVRLCNFLDASLQFDGRNTTVTTATVTGYVLGAAGEQVTIAASSNIFVAGDVGSSFVLDPDGKLSGPYEFRIIGYTDAQHVTAEIVTPYLPNGPIDFPAATTSWAFGRKTLTGFAHLEGQTVTVLADGAVVGPFVVAAGIVTLNDTAVLAQVGLGYRSDMELLDVASDKVQTNQKSARKLTLAVADSRGVYAGQSFDDADLKLYTPKQQSVADGPTVPPLMTGNIEITLASSWTQGGRACVRQSDPLPLEILSATRELVLGGR